MKLRTKIILMFSMVITVGTASMGTFAGYSIQNDIVSAAQEKLKSDLALGRTVLETKYEGEWQIKGDKLYKGDTAITENIAIVDEIAKATGDNVTIFMKDTRVATTVKKDDGSRAVGTKVSDTVADAVLKNGQTYIGEAVVVGKTNRSAYEPIKNAKGETIGMWFVGVPSTVSDEITSNFQKKVWIFGIIGLIVGIAVAAGVAEYNVRPLRQITAITKRVADGDLTVDSLPSRRKDEFGILGNSVNEMVLNLRGLLSKVNETAEQVASSSQELSATTDNTAEATEQITSNIQQVAIGAESQVQSASKAANAMEEMSTGIERIAETAVTVAETSLEAAREAEVGDIAVQKAVRQMDTILGSVNTTATGVKQLETRSLEIGQIVQVITGIAAQTNLLALNAAIEASRAGEHGRGFAVVADEVRKLAEQSGISAGQISELIRSIQDETTKAVQSMDGVIKEVQSGTHAVSEAGDAFKRILDADRLVADQIQDVSASAQEMSANTQQVAEKVAQMMQIAQQSADSAQTVAATSEEQLASIEEIAASSVSLAGMANQLREMIRKFKV
ncbi:methyl-accepting chemotaxis protein [Tumebacillus permanentifrigoris]|uniref:Methyl-accepting chemotaxis protein n=1 Tax=Tumebacillus permanentifrigoris TaxID=378543 RepID=A0A316D2M5_9BACL|nr:methyl-accepting chemotaxis protein [Tumebacillus permanentifrigoris]PWK05051.1 methyl-accepting chemotaxis protein [Tumebacillus permanentifrigoris]